MKSGIDFMFVLGAFAPGSSNFATRCQIIGAKFVTGHINYPLEHLVFLSFYFFYYFNILYISAKK